MPRVFVEKEEELLSKDIRRDVDRAWDAVWSTGVTNPIVVSDLLGTILMACASPDRRNWDDLYLAASQKSQSGIASLMAGIRRTYGIDPGSEIETPEFWSEDHSVSRVMNMLGSVAEAHGDVLGDIYEHILSKLSLAGHFGQFRTPRHIVDFMVELVDAQDGEVVVDPACGSGGFLVAASDYRKSLGRQGVVEGIEVDRTIARIAVANSVFHAVPECVISQGDGLTRRLQNEPDVILANPPFAGAVSSEVAGTFDSGTSKTELLFVESIAKRLKHGGRAAVIVPSSVLTASTESAKYVRSLLVEKNVLDAVIELPSGVFRPYTDVKTAILFWRRSDPIPGGSTRMLRVDADGLTLDSRRLPTSQNDLPQILDLFRGRESTTSFADVNPKTLAQNNYNLNPSRYLGLGLEGDDELVDLNESFAQLEASAAKILETLTKMKELI